MAGAPPQDMQPFTIYKRLCQTFIQCSVENGVRGCPTQNDMSSLCAACPQRIHRPTLFTSRLFRTFVPFVYAAETGDMTEEKMLTISEKVAASRPKIHISDLEIERYLAKETGRQRVREMYTYRNAKQLTPELTLVLDVSRQCALISFVFASVLGSMQAKEDFITEHTHTKFASKIRARRMLYDATLLAGLKNGMYWAVKCGVFTALLIGTSQTVSMYRNKTSVLEYIVAGAVTGGILKINLGPKGVIAGGIIGSVFGLVGGLAIYGVLVSSNETQEQRHYWYIHNKLYASKEAKALEERAQGGHSTVAEFKQQQDLSMVS